MGVASCIHYAIVAAAFAAQLALNYPSNLQLEGPSFWSCEALRRLPTPPKAKAGTAKEGCLEKSTKRIFTTLTKYIIHAAWLFSNCCNVTSRYMI